MLHFGGRQTSRWFSLDECISLSGVSNTYLQSIAHLRHLMGQVGNDTFS